MNATAIEPTIADGVLDLLRQHGCENELPIYLDIVRECFPDMRGLSVDLLHDPDEDSRIWVVLSPRLPAAVAQSKRSAATRRFLELKAERFPFRLHPAFSLIITYVTDET
jgi:hypothetical protein